MFTITEVATPKGVVQYREERFTGCRCRISPDRSKRHVLQPLTLPPDTGDCPFCCDRIFSVTPVFPDGRRIIHGESITFPNMFPFGQGHVVTVITDEHRVDTFTRQQIADALSGQVEALLRYDGYPSINMNFLPSAGASMVHPHMQGLSDVRPSRVMELYMEAGRQYQQRHGMNYWDALREEERASGRYLFGDEILWSAHAVPCGEREVRGLLPVSSISEMDPYIDLLARGILEVLAFYRCMGTYAFNMSIFFDKGSEDNGFHAFCSLISRINPNPSSMSDSAFMERMHGEPIVMTIPEEMGDLYRNGKK
ncbi:MAG: galactose-1-phosphate uridylyltransferase [Methanoregula sp.]|jgi:galactose-1-phosphate uridylyltransferase|uniref:galactose-1-phosphate uridylyltransferase n=1 Tax=Methanoregula sp. TaxID=2052170 RepID=UPI0025CE33B6|nr:galactose-1-phosphate uridylyltransferase [Methanoregula sp.]MCK9632819.1 galactose-1-phosphate uridylyltransferase [Methanoregula sp.]